jgi:hypothetical protein
MSNINSDSDVNLLLLSKIDESDTIKEFMEKCNNNFTTITEWNGGPIGATGIQGPQGIPTKPQVPIHVWKKGEEYKEENTTSGGFVLKGYENTLEKFPYQEGHLIILENAHVYLLEIVDTNLIPNFKFVMKSFDEESIKNEIHNGKKAYVHFKFSDSPDVKEKEIKKTQYIGISSTYSEKANDETKYTWYATGYPKENSIGIDKINLKDGDIDINKIKISDSSIDIKKINTENIQNSNFTNTLFSKQVMSTSGYITDSLNTKPESNGDKVIVGGNNIKLISEDGSTAVLFTTDEINKFVEYTDNITHKTYSYDHKTYSYDTLYTNFNNQILDSGYNEIGYLGKKESTNTNGSFLTNGSLLKFTIIVSIYENNSICDITNFNIKNFNILFDIYDNNWETSFDSGAKYIDDIIKNLDNWIYCNKFGEEIGKEIENKYYKKFTIYLSFGEKFTPNENLYTSTSTPHHIHIDDSGIYRFKTTLESGKISYGDGGGGIENKAILLNTICEVFDEITDINNIEKNCVTIGKNGIIVNTYNDVDDNIEKNCVTIGKNGIIVNIVNTYTDDDDTENTTENTFKVSNNEILMMVGKFGLKISNEGIFKTNDGSSWEDL